MDRWTGDLKTSRFFTLSCKAVKVHRQRFKRTWTNRDKQAVGRLARAEDLGAHNILLKVIRVLAFSLPEVPPHGIGGPPGSVAMHCPAYIRADSWPVVARRDCSCPIPKMHGAMPNARAEA